MHNDEKTNNTFSYTFFIMGVRTMTQTKSTTKKTTKKATKPSLIPPFRPGRQNIVCSMIFSGMKREEIIDNLPNKLRENDLGESRNVRSLIDTTIVGLRQCKNWTVVYNNDGTYTCTPPKSKK